MGRYDGTFNGNNSNNYFKAHKKSFGPFGLIKRWGSWDLYGNGGDDTLIGGPKNDFISGGSGNDRLYGLGGNDSIYGGYGNDYLSGGSGNDYLNGGSGNDYLSGGSGNDVLVGGAGNDTLVGGTGRDVMTDNAGYDVYKYFSTIESQVGIFNRDVLTDFTQGYDRVDLSSIDANRYSFGNQNFKFIGTSSFTGTGGEVRYFRSGSNLVLEADIHGDGNRSADMQIQFNGLSSIGANDLIGVV